MTKKRRRINFEDFPEIPPARHDGFETMVLRNEELFCAITSGHSVVSMMFNPQKIRSEFEGMIKTMIARLSDGKKVDMANPKTGTYAELGAVEMKFTNNLDLAVRIGHFTNTAWRFYMDAIISELEELPERLMMQAMLGATTEMSIDGSLNFKEKDGAAKMWNCYLDSLKEKIGNEWNKPKRGTKRYWSPALRRLLLDYYEARLAELTELKNTYEAGEDKDWLKRVPERYPGLDISIAKRVKLEDPETIARELTLKFLNRRGDDQFAKQLREAQRERKAREDANNAREADARHMYAVEFVDGHIRPINLSIRKP